jgi:AhpD family alkylhydroperoxidase
MNFNIPDSLFSENNQPRRFTLRDLYSSLIFVPGALRLLKKNKSSRLVDEKFIERLMLAVTEVNGCVVCSWAHTQMALSKGMSSEEISSLLSGGKTYIKPEEAKGILFAQHYADTKGRPLKSTYQAVMNEYGAERTKIILSAAQVMLTGNIYGLAYSALLAGKRNKTAADRSPVRNIGFLAAGILLVPFALIHVLLRCIAGLPDIRYGTE